MINGGRSNISTGDHQDGSSYNSQLDSGTTRITDANNNNCISLLREGGFSHLLRGRSCAFSEHPVDCSSGTAEHAFLH